MAAVPARQGDVREIAELLADDRASAAETIAGLRGLRDRTGETPFSSALFLVARLERPEDEAEALWEGLRSHREDMVRRLGRDPGLRVCLFDYLFNVRKLLRNPAVVERSEYEKTERSARTDALTGLANRRHFQSALTTELRRSRRYGLMLSVLMLDLDHFKRINDEHGHPYGDLVLQTVASVLRKVVREADVPCRYGGEEFAVILPETDRLGAYTVAERIRRAVQRRFEERPPRDVAVQVHCSGGISSFPEDGSTVESLIAAADRALYVSKSRGRDRISLFHAERRESVRYPVRSGAKVAAAKAGDPRAAAVEGVDLSEGGVLMLATSPFEVGEEVSLRFDGRDGSGKRRSWLHAGRVVRHEVLRDARSRVAVAFDRPLPQECLRQQVRRRRRVHPSEASP